MTAHFPLFFFLAHYKVMPHVTTYPFSLFPSPAHTHAHGTN